MNRSELASELMRGVQDDARDDHQAIADAIARGDTREQILAMPETDRWPDTYMWLKTELPGTGERR